MKPHPHAALMAEYAKDAALDGECWKNWEVLWPYPNADWTSCTTIPQWVQTAKYRRRPRVIVINGIEVPEPMREAPDRGTKYFAPALSWVSGLRGETEERCTWTGDPGDRRMLEFGFCHATREAAELHAKALLSFTAQQP